MEKAGGKGIPGQILRKLNESRAIVLTGGTNSYKIRTIQYLSEKTILSRVTEGIGPMKSSNLSRRCGAKSNGRSREMRSL
jgi:hypothetical protein